MIHIENVDFGYSTNAKLFSGLSLTMASNSITGLLGKNGAGKTSLLKLISGLCYPQAGHIRVMEQNSSLRQVDFLAEVYFLPENFQMPHITLREYVKAYAPFYKQFDMAKLLNLMETFELDIQKKIKALSFGQTKKFMIAFALSTNCKLLILDEPTNGLDIPSKSIFRKVMAGSLSENQLVVISTHQVKDVENLLDQLVILDNGKVVFNQSMAEISNRYSFIPVSKKETAEHYYAEATPGGYKLIAPANDSETQVDIELLFNAVVNDKLKTN